MASNRHLGRIVALQTLYEYDFRVYCDDTDVDIEDITMRNIGRYHDTLEDKEFVQRLVDGVSSSITKLDEMIAPIAPEWPVEQIARIDKVILRIALWELHNNKDVPPKVVINEAVELAKAFGGDNSSKFVNGVLGTAYRQLSGEPAKPAKKTKADAAKKPTEAKKPAAKKKPATKKPKKTDKE